MFYMIVDLSNKGPPPPGATAADIAESVRKYCDPGEVDIYHGVAGATLEATADGDTVAPPPTPTPLRRLSVLAESQRPKAE